MDIFEGYFLIIMLLIFFRSSIGDGKEVNQKTWSLKLTLKMKSHKPDNVDKLKMELIVGRLTKFEVANFPSIVDSMPPMQCLVKFCC